MLELDYGTELDKKDPLAKFRERFVISDPELIYLDGNSLGRLPLLSKERLVKCILNEWGDRLIRSWDNWLPIARRIGDKLAENLLGAQKGEVVITDNVTINLYKLLNGAIDIDRPIIVTNIGNFPTDKYVPQRISQRLRQLYPQLNIQLMYFENDPIYGPTATDVDKVLNKINGRKAIVLLSHVDYKSGALADMEAINKVIRRHGALSLWDLCHSVGVVPIQLNETRADLAVGCTYKYLNGGPGSPAFLYVNKNLLGNKNFFSPIGGWFSQKNQFSFGDKYDPHTGIERFFTGTPPIISVVAIEPAIDMLIEAGIEKVRKKSNELTNYFLYLYNKHIRKYDFTLVTPQDSTKRGSHISLGHGRAFEISLALRNINVIPDFRPPDVIRIGLAPLYTRFIDVYNFTVKLKEIMEHKQYKEYYKKENIIP